MRNMHIFDSWVIPGIIRYICFTRWLSTINNGVSAQWSNQSNSKLPQEQSQDNKTTVTPPLTSQISVPHLHNPKNTQSPCYICFSPPAFLFPSQHCPLMPLTTQPPSWRRDCTARAAPRTGAMELDLQGVYQNFLKTNVGAKISN